MDIASSVLSPLTDCYSTIKKDRRPAKDILRRFLVFSEEWAKQSSISYGIIITRPIKEILRHLGQSGNLIGVVLGSIYDVYSSCST